jgi:proteasome lid subunit RPN8/RPN11
MKELEIVADEHHDEEHSKFKKVFVFVAGLIMILLMLSFVLVSYPIGNIILGQLESDQLNGNRIDLDEFSIIFENGTEKEIKEIYFSEQKIEFSLCLLGRKQGNNYHINSFLKPNQVGRFNHVSFEPCPSDTLILFHTHPYKSCIASSTDINTLEKSKEKNSDVIMVIMCEPERFSVYG